MSRGRQMPILDNVAEHTINDYWILDEGISVPDES